MPMMSNTGAMVLTHEASFSMPLGSMRFTCTASKPSCLRSASMFSTVPAERSGLAGLP